VDAEERELAMALGLPAGSRLAISPLTAVTSSCRLVQARLDQPPGEEFVIRTYAGEDDLRNHAAVLAALNETGYRCASRLVTLTPRGALEERPPGVAAIAIAVAQGQAAEVCRALAALHASGLSAGRAWGDASGAVPSGELPLFRLGFTAEERARAAEPTIALEEAIGDEWTGVTHGRAISANVVLGEGGPWLLDFASFGVGLQLFDVAAFLLTSGLGPGERRQAAEAYAAERGTERRETADMVDAAGLLWGLDYLLALPRREIELLGDDAGLEWLRLTARRVSTSIREPAGGSGTAAALREVLWPGGGGPQ